MEKDCAHCHGPHDPKVHMERKNIHHFGKKCDRCPDDREAHLAWAKKRALEYLPHDPGQAVASMITDLRMHEAWQDRIAESIFALGLLAAMSGERSTREWIEGWN